MKTQRGFFWHAQPWWAVVEGWLLGLLILGLIAFVMSEASAYTTGQGVVLAVILAGGWSALRARFGTGKKAGLIVEIAWGLLLAAGMMLIESGLVMVFNVTQELRQSNIGELGVYLVLAGTALVYLAARIASQLLRAWIRLVHTRFQWKLTNIILLLVGLVGLVFVMALSALSRPSMFALEPVEDVSPLVPLIDMLVRTIFPYVAMTLAITLAGILIVLPPAFLVAYLASRGLTKRLNGLVMAARKLRSGDWSARVVRSGEDELGQLQEDFNAMAIDLEKANQDLHASRDQVASLLNAQRELTATVSHELRTPVATLRGYVENDLNRGQSTLPEDYLRDLEIMQHEVVRLQGLIDDLFTLSRAEVGQLTLNLTELDAGQLVGQVVEMVKPAAWRAGKVDVTAEAADAELRVKADPIRLEQALRNLIDNAVRHTPPGGIVAVQARPYGDEVEIAVADTGSGITAEDLPHIWERFYHADNGGGSGLGLALVKELVEAMGGTVGVESQAGQGSRFRIRLNKAS